MIEAQHQEMLERVARLDAALARGDRQEVGSMLAFLRGYVVEHFAEEELQMRVAAFPQLAAHKAAHDGFMMRFLKLELEFEAEGATGKMAARAQQVIASWLQEHIRGLDVELERYLAARRPA